jgi:hypothetical protein
MNFDKLLTAIENAVNFIESLTPIAASIGGPIVGNISSTILTVTDIIHNIVARADEAGHVFAETDQSKINEFVNRLALQNDKLAELIRNS